MMHPTMASALRGFMPPKRAKKTDNNTLVVVNFKGFALTAEIDGGGDILGIYNDSGVDCAGIFTQLVILEIESLVEAQCIENHHGDQFDRAAERAEC